MNSEDRSDRILQLARALHFAFMVSLVIYAAVVWIVTKIQFLHSSVLPDSPDQLRYVFYAVVVLIILLIRKIKPLLRKHHSFLQCSVITSAICELPALLGLVYFFLTSTIRDFIYLTILSLILLIMHYPRYDRSVTGS